MRKGGGDRGRRGQGQRKAPANQRVGNPRAPETTRRPRLQALGSARAAARASLVPRVFSIPFHVPRRYLCAFFVRHEAVYRHANGTGLSVVVGTYPESASASRGSFCTGTCSRGTWPSVNWYTRQTTSRAAFWRRSAPGTPTTRLGQEKSF